MSKISLSNLELSIPDDMVVIPKAELDRLWENELAGRMWGIADVAKRLSVSDKWVRNEILYNPRFKLEIENLKLQGVVIKGPGTSPWRFQASKFGPWLDNHIQNFNWG